MTKKELEKIIKEYAEENDIKEMKIDIVNLYGGKKSVEVKVR